MIILYKQDEVFMLVIQKPQVFLKVVGYNMVVILMELNQLICSDLTLQLVQMVK